MNRLVLKTAFLAALAQVSVSAAQELKVTRLEKCQPFATGRRQCSVVASKVDCTEKKFVEPHAEAPPVNLSDAAAKQSENRWKIGQLSVPKACEPYVIEEMSEGILAAYIDTAKLGVSGYVAPQAQPAVAGSAPAAAVPAASAAVPAGPAITSAVLGPEGPASTRPVGIQVEQASGHLLLAGDLVRVRIPRNTPGVQEGRYAAVAVAGGAPVWHIRESAALASNYVFDGLPYTVWLNLNTGPEPHDRIEAELMRQGVSVARWSLIRPYAPQADWFRMERETPSGPVEPVFEPNDQILIRVRNSSPSRELDLLRVKLVQVR